MILNAGKVKQLKDELDEFPELTLLIESHLELLEKYEWMQKLICDQCGHFMAEHWWTFDGTTGKTLCKHTQCPCRYSVKITSEVALSEV